MMPTSPRRLSRIKDFLDWRAAVENLLASYDVRLAGAGRAGVVVNYVGSSLPGSLLPANGTTVSQATYPRLFAELGTTYNVGGEPPGTFRLPGYATPPEHGVWAITT